MSSYCFAQRFSASAWADAYRHRSLLWFFLRWRGLVDGALAAFVAAASSEGPWLDEREHGEDDQPEEYDEGENLPEQHEGTSSCCLMVAGIMAQKQQDDKPRPGDALAHSAKRMYYGFPQGLVATDFETTRSVSPGGPMRFRRSLGDSSNPRSSGRTLRMTSKLPLVLLAVLLVNQIFNPARLWVGIIVGLAVVLGLCYVWAWQLAAGISARRHLRGTWVLAGDVLNETFVVENSSSMPAMWVEVIDHSELPGYHVDWVASVDPMGRQTYRTEGRCQHRGVFTLGPWELRTGDPLGIFEVTIDIPEARSILVYPRAMVLPDLHLPRGDAPGTARTNRRTLYTTPTAATVRPYVPGDPLRSIHWRRTARQGEYMVKEFDLEPSGDLWIALDLDQSKQAGAGAESTLEYAITLTASLATQMLAENRRVGLSSQGYLVPPQNGQLQLWRILEVLAHVSATPDTSMAQLLRDLRQNAGRGRTIVAITASADPAWCGELLHLAERGNAPAALLLDAPSFATEVNPPPAADGAMATLRGLLAEHGVVSHLIDRSFVFRPVHQITRTHTELRTLSATGRVISVEVEETV